MMRPSRKPFATFEKPSRPFEKPYRTFRETILDLPSTREVVCERPESNRHPVKDRNPNPETVQRSQLCMRSNSSRDDNFPCVYRSLEQLRTSLLGVNAFG